MISGQYSIQFDKTGFPLIAMSGWSFFISLLPVSKYQFERFASVYGTGDDLYTDAWYRSLLAANPRASWKNTESAPWKLFFTGATSEELRPFLDYLGSTFRLPKREEWILLHEAEADIRRLKKDILEDVNSNSAAAIQARHWLQEDLFPLTSEGLLEMVREENTVFSETLTRVVGKPFRALHKNYYNPTSLREVPNIDLFRRLVGFRVVMER